MATPVRCITFDATGTLMRVRGSVGERYAFAARQHGLKVKAEALGAAFSSAFRTCAAENPNFGYPDVPSREWWKRVVYRTFLGAGYSQEGLEPVFSQLFDVFAGPQGWECYPETTAALEGLRARGLHLGVISNFDERLPGILKSLRLDHFFDWVVVSRDVGHEKPHRAIFEVGLALAGLPAGSALHIGDNEKRDYEGARAAGMNAALLVRDEPPGMRPGPPAVSNLMEILQWPEILEKPPFEPRMDANKR